MVCGDMSSVMFVHPTQAVQMFLLGHAFNEIDDIRHEQISYTGVVRTGRNVAD